MGAHQLCDLELAQKVLRAAGSPIASDRDRYPGFLGAGDLRGRTVEKEIAQRRPNDPAAPIGSQSLKVRCVESSGMDHDQGRANKPGSVRLLQILKQSLRSDIQSLCQVNDVGLARIESWSELRLGFLFRRQIVDVV